MRYLMGDLGIDTRGQDFVTMHEQLNEVLVREANNGKRFVLVIDEAQNLDDSVLETARLLSDFETPTKKLLQIVFAGQPQLAEKLKRPELAQLRQRISILGRLEPFSATEVLHYINHRLRIAGRNSDSPFTPAAFERITASSKGIPRNINILCFNALSLGCALGRQQIDADLISAAESDLDLSSVADERWREGLPVTLPVPARPTASAAEMKIRPGSEGTPIKELVMGSGDPASTNEISKPFNNWRDELRASVTVDNPLSESLEHARARGADILAEIIVDGASGNAYFCLPQDCHTSSQTIATAPQQTEFGLTYPYSAHGDCKRTPRRDVLETVAPDGLRCTSGREYPIGRLSAVASVFVLALFVAILYRQDLITAAAQTRGALILAAASISPHLIARQAEPAAAFATTEHRLNRTGSEPSVPGALVPEGVTATLLAASTSVRRPSHPVKARRTEAVFTETTAVTVRARDDLRQICLRQLGRYTDEVLHKIRELNPELSDPDRITVGQRIVLPTSSSFGTNAVEPEQ